MRPDELEDLLWLANEMEQEFYEELMSEPAHGHNHGRERGHAGGWQPLETDPRDFPSYKRVVDGPRKHGTAYTYTIIGCRCDLCRAWKSAYNRAKRNPSDEEVHPQ